MKIAAGKKSLYTDIFPSSPRYWKKFEKNHDKPDVFAIEKASEMLQRALDYTSLYIYPGIKARKIIRKVHRLLLSFGADRHIVVHISPEDVLWHGCSDNRILEDGEIVTVDAACSFQGWWADAAATFPVGTIDEKRANLIEAAQIGTQVALQTYRGGTDGTDAAKALRLVCKNYEVSLIQEAGGHGIGRDIHLDPAITYGEIPHDRLVPGFVYTVEPIFSAGKPQFFMDSGGYVFTMDSEPSAYFEISILMGKEKAHPLGSPSWLNTTIPRSNLPLVDNFHAS